MKKSKFINFEIWKQMNEGKKTAFDEPIKPIKEVTKKIESKIKLK